MTIIHNISGNTTEPRQILEGLPIGTVVQITSNNDRSSADIRFGGVKLAWFSKSEEQLTNSELLWANRSALVGQIVQQRPFRLSLHQAGVVNNRYSDEEAQHILAKLQSVVYAQSTPTKKENTMNMTNFFDRLINLNKAAAADAAYLETGRIANNTVARIVTGRLPFLARFSMKTPMAKLAIANASILLAQQLRPNDQRITKLAKSMTTVAYQEMLQTIDIEGMIDQLLAEPAIQRALAKTDTAAATAAERASFPGVQ